jgi:hypothetical protein
VSIADIYFSANEQLRLENLVPFTEEMYEEIPRSYWEEDNDLTFEEWKEKIAEKGYEIDRIRKNPSGQSLRQFFYVGDYYTVEMNSLEPSWLLSEFVLPSIHTNERQKEKFLNKDYRLFFFPEWNTFAIDYFLRLYKEIDKEKLWEVFQMLYTHANYGFEMFSNEVLEEVFTYADNQSSIATLQGQGAVDTDGYLTIYRGEGKRSTPLENAYSWTLSKSIANRFANHFEKGRIYQAKVKVENIISYENEREEEEILVRFQDVDSLQIIEDVQ